MFSRRKEKIAAMVAENTVYFAKIAEGVRQEIAAAGTIADAGDRYLAFVSLEEKIHDLVGEAVQRVEAQVKELLAQPKKRNGKIIGASGFGIGLSALVGSMFITGGAAFPVLLIGGGLALIGETILISSAGDGTVRIASDNALAATKDSFDRIMKTLAAETQSRRDAILHKELPGLLSSAVIGVLCEKVPAVQTAFTKAALKDGVFSPPVKLDKPLPPKPKQ